VDDDVRKKLRVFAYDAIIGRRIEPIISKCG
jgi:hypothetical protein